MEHVHDGSLPVGSRDRRHPHVVPEQLQPEPDLGDDRDAPRSAARSTAFRGLMPGLAMTLSIAIKHLGARAEDTGYV